MLRPNLQSANISYSMQKRLLFKIDYVCKIPYGGGAGSFLAGSLSDRWQELQFVLLVGQAAERSTERKKAEAKKETISDKII